MTENEFPNRLKSQEHFDNAIVGKGTFIEPDVQIGYRYHKDCGIAQIGEHGILRKGTIIYGDVTVGNYFQTGHYAVVRAKVKMGDYCTVFNHSVLEGIIRMGDGVRIMANVYIPSRTWFGNHIFVGPGVTFLNDKLCARYETPGPVKGATVEDDVTIGGGATILPGVTIGRRSFVAAGAIVTKDVPPGALVIGCPGQIKPLPEKLNRDNCREITIQPVDIWHPLLKDLSSLDWPEEWQQKSK